jgi:hypothetical protein
MVAKKQFLWRIKIFIFLSLGFIAHTADASTSKVFELKHTAGKNSHLLHIKGKCVIVNYWAIW